MIKRYPLKCALCALMSTNLPFFTRKNNSGFNKITVDCVCNLSDTEFKELQKNNYRTRII